MSNAEIAIYYSSSVLGLASKLADYQDLLDKDERLVVERFKSAQLRQRYMVSHGILRQLLAQRVGVSAISLRIKKTQFGKPFLPDYPDLSFNMSHSGNTLAIAISNFRCQLGVDVECYKPRRRYKELVKKCFAPEEAAFWYSQNERQRTRVFYQFWVKKEAFVKAVGRGIALGLNQCVVNPNHLNSFLRVSELAGLVAQWQIYALHLSTWEFGAVVCNKKNAHLHVFEL